MTTKAATNGCCYKKNEHILVLFAVIEACKSYLGAAFIDLSSFANWCTESTILQYDFSSTF